MTVLEGKKLVKIYGGKKGVNSSKALNGVNISVEEEEFVGVMGPSGSGKTTLLNILSGIDKLTSGTAQIAGKNIARMRKNELALFRRKNIGFVFQDYNLLDSLTIKENIMLPLILEKKQAAVMEKKAQEIMSLFGILDIADKYPYSVSGGEQQRASIARAIINEPAIVFADEPTGNLDTKSSQTIMESFRKINEEKKSTILMVTHDPFAASFCKRIIYIKDGQVKMEIARKGKRKAFFNRILDCLALMGGDRSEV